MRKLHLKSWQPAPLHCMAHDCNCTVQCTYSVLYLIYYCKMEGSATTVHYTALSHTATLYYTALSHTATLYYTVSFHIATFDYAVSHNETLYYTASLLIAINYPLLHCIITQCNRLLHCIFTHCKTAVHCIVCRTLFHCIVKLLQFITMYVTLYNTALLHFI